MVVPSLCAASTALYFEHRVFTVSVLETYDTIDCHVLPMMRTVTITIAVVETQTLNFRGGMNTVALVTNYG